MDARLLLGLVLTAGLVMGSGCGGGGSEASPSATAPVTEAPAPTASPPPTTEAPAPTAIPPPTIDRDALRISNLFHEWPNTDPDTLTVDPAEIMSGGRGRDRIVALDAEGGVEIKGPGGRASFAPVSEVLYDDTLPIAYLTVGGHTRGYPLSILASHEIVNDVIEGLPVLATYCPLCNTALAFERTVAGRVLDFGVSGLLRHADLIMFDRQTESWWQQVTGEAIAGVFANTSLKPLAMSVLSYRDFAAAFPAADILTTDTGYSYRYDLSGYVGYDSASRPFAFSGDPDPRLPALERVVALEIGGQALAVPFSALQSVKVANIVLAAQAIAVFWSSGTVSVLDDIEINEGRDVGSAVAFDPEVDGEVLSFEPVEIGVFRDRASGSLWDASGLAIDGPLAGARLSVVQHGNYFWFAWAAFYPGTAIWADPGP